MDGDLSEVLTSDRMVEAQIIKTKLESEGIPALLRYESAGQVYGIMINGLAKISIMVPSDRLADAQKALAESEPTADEFPDEQ
jgi:hypothetical protein